MFSRPAATRAGRARPRRRRCPRCPHVWPESHPPFAATRRLPGELRRRWWRRTGRRVAAGGGRRDRVQGSHRDPTLEGSSGEHGHRSFEGSWSRCIVARPRTPGSVKAGAIPSRGSPAGRGALGKTPPRRRIRGWVRRGPTPAWRCRTGESGRFAIVADDGPRRSVGIDETARAARRARRATAGHQAMKPHWMRMAARPRHATPTRP